MEPMKGVKLRESASRDVAGELWLVILEEALEHHDSNLLFVGLYPTPAA